MPDDCLHPNHPAACAYPPELLDAMAGKDARDAFAAQVKSRDAFAAQVALAVVDAMQDNRLPAAYMAKLAGSLYRYSLFTRPGEWASVEFQISPEATRMEIRFLDANNVIAGRFVVFADE